MATKRIKDLKAGEYFRLSPTAKRTWVMGVPSISGFFYKLYYDRATRKYCCVPFDDVLGGGRDFAGDKQVVTGFTF